MDPISKSVVSCHSQKYSDVCLTLVCRKITSQVLFSPFAGRLHLLSCSEIKQQRETTPGPPASHMARHNSTAVLWLLFASGSGEELTEPWPHLPPPPPILHLQELGLPVVWQEFCKHVPQSASPCLPPPHALTREETPQPGMWKGISMALMRSASFSSPWDSSCRLLSALREILPRLVEGWDSAQIAPRVVPSVGLLSWLPPSFPAWWPPSQGSGSPPLAREQEGEAVLGGEGV